MKFAKLKTNFFLVFLIFFLSTRASGLSISNFFLFGSLIFTIAIAASRKIRIDKSFMLFLAFVLIIIIQNFIQLGEYFETLRYLKLLSLLVTAYLTIKIVRFDFFVHFNKIVLYAILLSLPFYVWQLIAVDSLHSLGKILSSTFSGLMDVSTLADNQSLNILFYTIEFVENFRNSGPMWEPGGFATFIVLALFFELLQNNYSFTKRCWIYLLGIFITFSTTGYITTLIVIFFYLFKRAKQSSSKYLKVILYLTLPTFVIITCFVFFYSPIFYEKIVGEISSQNEMMENISDYGDTFKSLGRFGSLEMDMNSIHDTFIFGRGYTDENFTSKYENFAFTNGLSNFVGRMGIIGLFWLLFSLYKSGKLIFYGLTGSFSGSFVFLVLVITIAFSNPVLFTPLFVVLQLFFIPFKPSINGKLQAGNIDRSD